MVGWRQAYFEYNRLLGRIETLREIVGNDSFVFAHEPDRVRVCAELRNAEERVALLESSLVLLPEHER